ncbi:Omp28-related outer membrane protein [Kaistella sp.]|uniref:Omp28-related outer membrane protein n=1 Tax=Kaistella sp. TaxID=2782235 RepID=UPI003C597A98
MSVKLNKFLLPNGETSIKAVLKNVGSNNISSVEFNWNDGTGDHKQRVVAYLSAGQQREVTHPIPVSLSNSTIETKTILVSITQVNDAEDGNPSDNNMNATTSIVSQAIPKKVVFEEGTGTWCGWCPRGMVALKNVNEEYPDDQISIGVHNGDPMAFAAYNSGAAFGSFPGMNVDRELKGVDINPSNMAGYINSRKTLLSPAQLTGEFSISGQQLTANVNSKFFINNPNVNYRLSVILIEDGVKGTASGFRQSNYYAGGSNGEMGGFESLPNPVPAAQMVYDHVGRALLGGYAGQESSIPSAITDGQTVNYTFNYTIPSDYIKDNLTAVVLLLDATDGTIISGAKLSKTILAVNDIKANAAKFSIYPNPAKSDFNLKLPTDGTYKIAIFDMAGRAVKNYGAIHSNNKTIKLGFNLVPGKYLVNISQDGKSITKELLVK